MKEKTVTYDQLLDYSHFTGKSMSYLLEEADARGFRITGYEGNGDEDWMYDEIQQSPSKPKSVTVPKVPKPTETEFDSRLLLMC